MVAISNRRRRVSTSRRFRRGSFLASLANDREKAGIFSLVSVFSLYLVWTLVLRNHIGGGGHSTAGGTAGSTAGASSLFRRVTGGSGGYPFPKNRPDLHVEGPNAESMNAIALDILETLQCHSLFNRSYYGSTTTSSEWTYADQNRYNREEQEEMAARRGGQPQKQERRRLQAAIDGPVDFAQQEVVPEEEQRKEDYRFHEGESGDDPFLVTGAARGTADYPNKDYNNGGGMESYSSSNPSASHLFCLAALWASSSSDTANPHDHMDYWKSRIQCPVTTSRPLSLELIELWSTARSEMTEDLLIKTLKATEHPRDLLGTKLHLWAPPLDDGIEYMLSVVNEKKTADEGGGLMGMGHNLGPSKLFVDVGSYLGVTSMAIALLYPGTRFVSIEAAPPNWLLQQINWRCNHRPLFAHAATSTDAANSAMSVPLPTILLSGVGPSGHTSHMAKMMWRPYATTATRSWTSKKELQPNDVEITVRLKPWHTLLLEADILNTKIDVLNVDCEGCEYNLIPALSESEFQAIPTILGTIHWGYIPDSKLPSSQRGRETHSRLCQHENVARTVKECCAFPDLTVISSVQGEALVLSDEEEDGGAAAGGGGENGILRNRKFPPRAVTVRDVAGNLCDNFDHWRVQHHLDEIESDWGWFQITSRAEV